MSTDDSRKFDEVYESRVPDFSKTLNIAMIGRVSSGKSSLLNALMECPKDNVIAEVGAISGVTTKLKWHKFGDNVLIIDCPGLDDIAEENSDVTKSFFDQIDVGILVVSGSSDVTQKKHYDDLVSRSKKCFVVVNKIDSFDDLNDGALEDVLNQWKKDLSVSQLYPVCCKGYDSKPGKALDLRGVDGLREDLMEFLRREGKDLLLARHLGDKRKYASRIISLALAAVAAEAFVPGSAAYITATQVVAITSLYYLYTGKVLEKSNALSLLPTFIGRSVGVNVFLWAKSFLPPTGVADVAAAGVAVAITFAMLGATEYFLRQGYSLDTDKAELGRVFEDYKNSNAGEIIKSIMEAIKNKSVLTDVIYQTILKR